MTLEEFVGAIGRYSCEEYFARFPEIDTALEQVESQMKGQSEEERQQTVHALAEMTETLPAWAKVHILSFCMAVGNDAAMTERLLQVVLEADYEEIGEYNKLSHYWQVVRTVFTEESRKSPNVEKLLAELYRTLLDAFSGALGIRERSYISKEERDDNLVFVFASQVLNQEHAPTKTLLDRCLVLKKVLHKEVVIINTAMHMTKKGRAPFYRMMEGTYFQELSEKSELEFRGETFPFLQCPENMPDLDVIADIIKQIQTRKPCCIISIGGNDICADICGRLVPEITVSTVFSHIATSCGEYQIIDKQTLTKEEQDCLHILGVEENKVKRAMFTFSFKEQTHHYTREQLRLPQESFLLVVIGWRLDDEVSVEFLQMLQIVISQENGIGIVFMGEFAQFKERLRAYPLLQSRSYNLGRQEDALAVLECVDLYVNPRRQGGGSSVAEALYKGIPAVTLPIGDVAVAAGETFHVPDYEKMAQQILCYAKDPAIYQRRSEQAKERAKLLMDSSAGFGKAVDEILHM
jgi:hypothetical protein